MQIAFPKSVSSSQKPTRQVGMFILNRHFELLEMVEDDCRVVGFWHAASLAEALISEFKRLMAAKDFCPDAANDPLNSPEIIND